MEWQTDSNGKRYRMIGNIKEYEMMVTIGGINVPESQIEAHNARMKEDSIKRRADENKAAAALPKVFCPFSEWMNTLCSGDNCALYFEGCTLAKNTSRAPIKETAGLQCPINRYNAKCRKDCALYRNGCTLTAIKTKKRG